MSDVKKIIAILEDNEARTQAMRAAIADALPDATCVFFNSAHAIIEWFAVNLDSVSLISLDHDLDFLPGPEKLIDPGDGRDVAQFLATQKPCCPVIVHTSNNEGAFSMMFTLQDAGWRAERVLPENDLEWVKSRWIETVARLITNEASATPKIVKIEGVSPEDILALSKAELNVLVFCGHPIVFQAGSAEVLGQFRTTANRLVLELAQIDGGGEGILPTIWGIAERYARNEGLQDVEWIIHAVNCARPNLKLRRVLERKNFVVEEVPGAGTAYHLVHWIK